MMLDLVSRIWVDEDGHLFEVTNAFDWLGEETDDCSEVRAIVIALPWGQFGVVDLRDFTPATLH